MIDTHCHLNDDKYNKNLQQVVNNYKQAGVSKVVCVAWDYPSSVKAKSIAEQFEDVYFSAGVHPDNVDGFDCNELEQFIKESQNDSRLVAIGEIGLDYFHNKENKEEQKACFIKQIKLANKYHLPIIIHCREAYGDTLDILKQFAPFKYSAVMHCFGGSVEYSKELVKLGVKMSFTGTVTFKNAKNVQQVAESLPMDSFFFETDCPYLTPEPNRGKQNEPKYVVDVLAFVARLRGVSYKELEDITDKNAKEFFKFS